MPIPAPTLKTLLPAGRSLYDFTRIPGGTPGIETRLQLLFDGGVAAGRFGIVRFVGVTGTAPARLFGLYPRKGVLAPGSDADVVVCDPGAVTTISAATHHMRVDHSIYEVPLMLQRERVDELIYRHLRLDVPPARMTHWQEVIRKLIAPQHRTRIGVVGKYIGLQDAYKSVYEAIIHGGVANDCGDGNRESGR